MNQQLNPTKEGHKFLYWTLNGQQYEFGKAVNDSITLKANWEKLASDGEKPKGDKNKTLLIVGVAASSAVLAAGVAGMVLLLLKKKKI